MSRAAQGDDTPFGVCCSRRGIAFEAAEIDRPGAFVATPRFVDLLHGLNRYTSTGEP